MERVVDGEWPTSWPGLADRSERATAAIDEKGWRWEGEIAATFVDAELPDRFHLAAGEVFAKQAAARSSS